MIRLARALNAWGTPDFRETLRKEIEQMGAERLPLQQGLSMGSAAIADGLQVMIISAAEREGFIRARAGVFYKGVIAGCSCADDPTPPGEHSEYCEVQLDIDSRTAETRVTLVED